MATKYRRLTVILIAVIVFASLLLALSRPMLQRTIYDRYDLGLATSSEPGRYLVAIGRMGSILLAPDAGPFGRVRLTRIQRQESVSPESGTPPTDDLVGRCVVVQGILDSDWLYEARIVETLGPLESRLARYAFGE